MADDNPICAICYVAPTAWPNEDLFRFLCANANVVFNANGVVHGTIRTQTIKSLLECMRRMVDQYGGTFSITSPRHTWTLYPRLPQEADLWDPRLLDP